MPSCRERNQKAARPVCGPLTDGSGTAYQRAIMSRGGGTRKQHGPSVASSMDGAVDTGHLPIFIARLQDWDGENFGTYSELLGISSDYFRMHGPSVASSMDGSCTAYQRAIMKNQEAARAVCAILHGWSCRSWNLPPCHHEEPGKQHGPSVASSMDGAVDTGHLPPCHHVERGEEPGSGTARPWMEP